jgi:NAD+ kinase
VTIRIAYLVKTSSLQAFAKRKTGHRIKRLLTNGDPTVARVRATHEAHSQTVEEVMRAFESIGADAVAIGPRTRDITKERFDLVVTVGGDGTLLRASHRVADVPILGINSAPLTSVGFFCGARGGGVLTALERALDGRLRARSLARMKVAIGKRTVSSRVLNDALFCHQSPAATSRYIVELGKTREEHKSSGFWIGPAAGSTAAQRSAGGRILPLESTVLQFVVREPYTPMGERYALRRVLVEPGQELVVRSKMHESALFLDGPDDHTKVAFGDILTFSLSHEPLRLLGIAPRRR